MKYGHFDDKAKEYVITRPDTPLPWINYLGNEGFFSLISNTAGGYTFYKDAKLRRITRFRYNNVPTDEGGRCFYIKDGDTTWSPAFLPAKTELDTYECHHGLGYTSFASSKNGVASTLTCFVPQGYNCELQKFTLTNNTDSEKQLKVFSALEWCLWNAVDDQTNFQRNFNIGEVEIEGSTIYHKTEYRERRNHYAFYTVNSEIAGFDTDRDTFLGRWNSWDKPTVVANGQTTQSVASGWAPIAAFQINCTLKPHESKTYIFELGYIENEQEKKFASHGVINKDKAHELIERFNTEEQFDAAFASLREYWDTLLARFTVETSEEKLDRMVNIWNQYQCMITFNLSRSASYYESGTGRGMGFRDSCQDLLGFMHLIPDRARERIIDIASIQFEDGSTYHQYQPLTKRGNADVGGGFNDDPLWLVACTSAYIRETGDYSILAEMTPFNNVEGSEVPLINHLRQSVHYIMEHRGPHGLPLIGRADWNDCLNLNCFSLTPGESFQTCSNFESGKAESVFIAGMFVKYGAEYVELVRRDLGKSSHCSEAEALKEAAEVTKAIEEITEAVKTAGWDGEWFVRAYDAFERPIGSKVNEEGKIYIEPQGMCTMAGIGGEEFGRKALASTEKYLSCDYGVELLHPCYTEYHDYLGEISSYPPGYKENGSVFCHNNSWIIMAYAKLHDGDGAWNLYTRQAPAFLEDKSEIHRTEPYVYSQTIAGRDAKNYGEAKNSWLTGTAAWTFVSASQGVLGIYPDLDGLRVEPNLPSHMDGYHALRLFRGTLYDITVKRDVSKSSDGSVQTTVVDGKEIEGTVIPATSAKTCKVTITM